MSQNCVAPPFSAITTPRSLEYICTSFVYLENEIFAHNIGIL